MYKFELFVAGSSYKMVDRVNEFLEIHLHGLYSLSIVDVVNDSKYAREQCIFATPVLVKRSPGSERRVFGNLTNPEDVLKSLGIVLTIVKR